MLDEEIAGVAIDRTFPGLPARDYYAEEVWAQERRTVFARSWFCVGRTEELAAPGDFVARDVAGEGVLAVRGRDGRIRAFYNVCRHRGSVLCDDGAGNTRGAFVCPYHNWTYDLEGNLVATPNVLETEDFDRSAYPLRGIACDEWEGFLFVHLGPGPRPLLDQLAEEPDAPLDYARYGVGELRIGHRIVYEVAANWKLIHDNFNECLHCPSVHRELTALVPMYRKGMVFDPDRPDLGAELADGLSTFTLTGTSVLPTLPGLGDRDCRTYWGYSIFPNVLMNLVSTGAMVYTLYPSGPAHTTIVSEYLYRPETIADPGFDCSDMVEFLDLVSVQDWSVCERAQRGVSSQGFLQGVYPPQDALLHRFAERYLEVRGPVADAQS
ncbi:MAG: aromatic ring-hydroxylating oxygenase subunit alpha [Actinomycetota bacterium]